jgi:hypothetical protein
MASIPYELYADNGLLWAVCENKHETIIIDSPKKILDKLNLENYMRELNPALEPYHICINSPEENRSYHYSMDDEANIQHIFVYNKLTSSDKNCMVISMAMFKKLERLIFYMM